jgi:hypothetical protein
MRKKFFILVLLICFCCSGLFAKDFWNYGHKAPSIITDVAFLGVGGWFIYEGFNNEPPYSYIYFGAGFPFALIGFFGLLYDIVTDNSDNYAKAIKEDPILNHVNFATNGKDTFIGARFSF